MKKYIFLVPMLRVGMHTVHPRFLKAYAFPRGAWERGLKKYFFILICIFFFGCQAAPDATDSNGKPIYFSDYRGKWMVVNYWATWCQPCLTELPALNTLHSTHADTLVVLAVNFDGLSPPEMQNFAHAQHLTLPLLSRFPVEKFGITEIASLPTTFLITPEGKLFKTLYGPQTEKSILENMKR